MYLDIIALVIQCLALVLGITSIVCTAVSIVRDARQKTSEEMRLFKIGIISAECVFLLYVIYWFVCLISMINI